MKGGSHLSGWPWQVLQLEVEKPEPEARGPGRHTQTMWLVLDYTLDAAGSRSHWWFQPPSHWVLQSFTGESGRPRAHHGGTGIYYSDTWTSSRCHCDGHRQIDPLLFFNYSRLLLSIIDYSLLFLQLFLYEFRLNIPNYSSKQISLILLTIPLWLF